MKFGKLLETEMYPPFAEGYVKYNDLKQSIALDEAGFGEKLRNEVERVAAYGDRLKVNMALRLDAAEKRWKDVQEWKRSDFPDVDKDVEISQREIDSIGEELKRVLDFVSLNVVGIKKICKKHDRRTGEVSGPLLLSKLQRDAEAAYLNKLSDPTTLESLVERCLRARDEIKKIKENTGKEHVRKLELIPAGGPDYFSIPRSREVSTHSSLSSASRQIVFDDVITQSCVDALARPLLTSDGSKGQERAQVAFTSAFLAGVGFGGIWTICEVQLTPWETAWTVVFLSFGSITGTRPALSKMYYGLFALAGALSAYIFAQSSTTDDILVNHRHPVTGLVCAWLAGTCLGAWTVQLPRQLVSVEGTVSWARAAVTLAPMLGSCFGASLLLLAEVKVSVFAQLNALAWALFCLYVWFLKPLDEMLDDSKTYRNDSEAETSAVDEETLEVESNSSEGKAKANWKKASSRVVTLGVLASLAIDRTVRTVVALEVVSFYPALWGEDFFLLSVGSILASFVGAVVPSWTCALIGCLSIYFLNGPGFIAWLWVEASCRNDLAKFSDESASTADTILYVADFIACVVFALELTYIEGPADSPVGLTFASGVLLLLSSVGRLVASRV